MPRFTERPPAMVIRTDITPNKPKKQPLALTPNKPEKTALALLALKKSAGTAKRPLALSGEKSRGAARKKAMKPSFQNPAVGGNDKLEQEIALVGDVHESDASHWNRHMGPSSSTCGRCLYIRHKAEFRREHPWLRPRPAHMGGPWRLGCDARHWRMSTVSYTHLRAHET